MRTAEIRRRWLDFFGKNDHQLCDSVPLVSSDPSILFTIAGMVPFIPYIVGTEKAPWPRAASVQKCIRTNDIDEVGKTTRHGTFFQMCGNFSFGDYFKEGASRYAWDLLTGSLDDGKYGLDGDKLWVTIWEHDDEARRIWLNDIGLDPAHLQELPREEIFWHTGQPGPAGPCAEIHLDRGPEYGPEGGPEADTKGDRYLEIWNLVFDEFLRGPGTGNDYELIGDLDAKCIDTGLGLERLAFVLQGKDNMYEIDEVFPVIAAAQEMSGKTYTLGTTTANPDDVRMRIVADHVRSALMLINDGVRPGNDGRGYVLRRLVRRAVRSMRLLGVTDPVLPTLLPVSQAAMAPSYPDLVENWDVIQQVAYAEEESFRRTLSAGTTILDQAVSRAKERGDDQRGVVSGEDAFTLHDTYGFPIDLTIEMAHESGVEVDEAAFRSLMEEQRTRARTDALEKKRGHVDTHVYHDLADKVGGAVTFLGYTDAECTARVVGILVDGQPVAAVTGPAEVEVILDQTPFYAEMGGQQPDHGTLTSAGATVNVTDVQAPIKGLTVHRGTLGEGELAIDDTVVAAIDTARRTAIARAHTATHMVHKALHEHLGEQATQAGSENSPSRMRFDFRHGQQIPTDTMEAIEARVNERLTGDLLVTDRQMPIDEARASGAMALFGEKYGDVVRVVDIGDGWSRELCAGTHVPTTGHIGRITVLGESSIGSGLRRIEALVGDGAYDYQAREHALVSQLSGLVGVAPDQLVARVEALMDKLKVTQKQMAKLAEAQLSAQIPAAVDAAVSYGSIRAVVHSLGEVSGADAVRSFALGVRERFGSAAGVAVIIGIAKGRPVVVVATTPAARDAGVRAGDLVRVAASAMGGGGGGKDDVAQGGGKDASRVEDALAAIRDQLTRGGRA
ncbi:alanine--tRNA ligase [Nanchangia anserum]|uniref:Alanine--tRNA ligase n=1 Tax=Nanchangia anserum TaxID=2692125 RepID=A0A8I0GAP1_9ACTO|nr:alanine--tRNA ligase [Nanchangia anserum]MBD3688771.1 alanine--tRNA ligase [Nanchangia anserum]QOX82509.1 alanine--tRNA ligase [Nanchangia anserum]